VIALAAGLSMIMIPKLRQAEGLPELKARSSNLMHYCFPIVAAVMVLSPVLFDFFFGPAYQESAMIFNLYLLLTLTQCLFPQSIIMARQDTRILWYVSMAELLVNVISSLVLLFYFGLIGIVWGTLIAFTFEKIVLVILVYKRYGIRVGQMVNIRLWFRYAIVLAAVFILSKWVFGIS
jgi:O-antigen/teichoic acid export membrane protein